MLQACVVDGETEALVMKNPKEVHADWDMRLYTLSFCAKWGLRGI